MDESASRSSRFQDPRFFAKNPLLEYAFIFSAILAQILTQAGANYILALLKVLTDDFKASDGERTWFMSSFSLATGTLILMTGRLGDVFGLKRAIVGGYICTIAFSLVCGFAYYVKTPTLFIVARAFQGAGIAFILPNVLGAAGRIYRPGSRRKHWIFSLVGFASPIGGCAAPIFSGLIAVKTKYWNWNCYAFSIAATLGLGLAWISIPDFPSERKSMAVDWIGCGLGFSALVLFNFVWNQAPNTVKGWGEPYIIAILVVSVVLLVVFVWYETHIPSNPLLPKAVVKDIRLSLSLLSMFLSWGSWGIAFYRFFVFLLYLRNYTPLAAGAALTPAFVFGTIAALSCGFSIRYVPVQYILVFSMAVFVGGDLLVVTLPVHQSYFKQSMGIFILAVFGMDLSFPAATLLMTDAMPLKQQANSGSLVLTMVNYGMSFCLGVAGTVEQQALKRHPGDTLTAHKWCMWFAVGLSGASVVTSLMLCLAYHLHAKREKSASPEKTDLEAGSIIKPGEPIDKKKECEREVTRTVDHSLPTSDTEDSEESTQDDSYVVRTASGNVVPEEAFVPAGPAVMVF